MRKKAVLVAVSLAAVVWAAPPREAATNLYEGGPAVATTPLDRIVFARLSELNVRPTLCSDAVFVRRAYLDVIGTLPTAQEARRFIQDPDVKNKRRLLIDRLLERDEFADYWAMKWGDILRIKAEFPVNLWPNAAQAYHRWVRASIAENKPYDRFARELLTSSGSNFRVGPVNFYRAVQNRTPEGLAAAVAQTFLGARTEGWSKERVAGMAAFFAQVGYKPTSEWKEEHVFWDPLRTSFAAGNTVPGRETLLGDRKPATGAAPAGDPPPALPPAPQTATFPDGTTVKLPADRDPREVFANWLISPKNPWFARVIANRVWAWLLGRGIVHEPDDFRDDNPPSNPALLAYLEKELVAHRYDLKHLIRTILNSSTYQLSSVAQNRTPKAAAQFASYPLRRLEAEVLIDAINKVTGTTDLYTSPIPEPFTYIPRDQPAIALADGSITSPFLTLFGRSARATGLENERVNKPTPSQWLHLLNSSHIQAKLEQGPRLREIVQSASRPADAIEELYLTFLSRFPTADELRTIRNYAQPVPAKVAAVAPAKKGKTAAPTKAAAKAAAKADQGIALKRREDWVDISWTLINSTEFLYRH